VRTSAVIFATPVGVDGNVRQVKARSHTLKSIIPTSRTCRWCQSVIVLLEVRLSRVSRLRRNCGEPSSNTVALQLVRRQRGLRRLPSGVCHEVRVEPKLVGLGLLRHRRQHRQVASGGNWPRTRPLAGNRPTQHLPQEPACSISAALGRVQGEALGLGAGEAQGDDMYSSAAHVTRCSWAKG